MSPNHIKVFYRDQRISHRIVSREEARVIHAAGLGSFVNRGTGIRLTIEPPEKHSGFKPRYDDVALEKFPKKTPGGLPETQPRP